MRRKYKIHQNVTINCFHDSRAFKAEVPPLSTVGNIPPRHKADGKFCVFLTSHPAERRCLVSTLCASYGVRRTSLVEDGECSAAAASWGRLSNCSRAQFSASFLNCPQLSGSWPGTGHRAVSRTNEGAQFCMLASTRGSVSRVVSPGHVAATLLCINYTFKDSIHCRLQEEDLWQWKDNL